ncbi:MAG: hypothetical protein J3Q66DRAFT_358119 [Benniella sp.]|nr:MAG: hypothetical protein J3Q66DRAFT_358119 [Benniella sp.]
MPRLSQRMRTFFVFKKLPHIVSLLYLACLYSLYSPQELYCWFECLTTLPASCTPVTRSRPSGIGVRTIWVMGRL